MRLFNITLIIPSNSSGLKLNFFFKNVQKWECFPREIILINSHKKKQHLDKSILFFLKKRKVKLKIIHRPNFYPGAARNTGIQISTYDTLAFLDISTHAPNGWLQYGYNKINKDKYSIIRGKTLYVSFTEKEKIIQAATYGFKSLTTLPGTIVKKNIFNIVGTFLNYIRAGEDAEWFYRINVHRIPTCVNKKSIEYHGLRGITYLSIIRKWFRNYKSANSLTYLNNSRDIYFVVFSILALTLSFNWNFVVYHWRQDEVFYIPHVTKISIFLIGLLYFIFRGIVIPLKKGTSLSYLFSGALFKISILSFFLDLTKMLTFCLAKIKKYKIL